MYVGIVYLYELYGNTPVAIFTVNSNDMQQEDWLVNALVRTLPNQDNFGWNGAHVLLSARKNFDIREYGPHLGNAHEGDIVFDCYNIHEAFLDSEYQDLEKNPPV